MKIYIEKTISSILPDFNVLAMTMDVVEESSDIIDGLIVEVENEIEKKYKLEDVLNGHYTCQNLYDLLIKRYKEYPVNDPKDVLNGKRLYLKANDNELLITYNKKCLAIYVKEKNYYVSKRGLF